ncbi:MAG: ubiquinol-cytochrome c reductase iron-sulfur subunit [Acidobacteriota bacterium]
MRSSGIKGMDKRIPYKPPPRRQFFKYLVNSIAAAIGVALGVPLLGFFILPAFKRPKLVWKECGPVDGFPKGTVSLAHLKSLEKRYWPEDWGEEAAWVYRDNEGTFVVYNMHCTHVGCPIRWSAPAHRFFCPCHGGVFDENGNVVAGPPPRPLDRYLVKVENGVLYAETAYERRGQAFEVS